MPPAKNGKEGCASHNGIQTEMKNWDMKFELTRHSTKRTDAIKRDDAERSRVVSFWNLFFAHQDAEIDANVPGEMVRNLSPLPTNHAECLVSVTLRRACSNDAIKHRNLQPHGTPVDVTLTIDQVVY